MPHVPVNGINIYYEVHGQGQPVFLIAGLGAAHTLWELQVRSFARDRRVVAFDNRGAGPRDPRPREARQPERTRGAVTGKS
ncbi:MAG: alpha/beta hydrolase, partial [Chloroflexota bacterium]|nr:alpha/beta hydrolase [Chloroflexota bacterium]